MMANEMTDRDVWLWPLPDWRESVKKAAGPIDVPATLKRYGCCLARWGDMEVVVLDPNVYEGIRQSMTQVGTLANENKALRMKAAQPAPPPNIVVNVDTKAIAAALTSGAGEIAGAVEDASKRTTTKVIVRDDEGRPTEVVETSSPRPKSIGFSRE